MGFSKPLIDIDISLSIACVSASSIGNCDVWGSASWLDIDNWCGASCVSKSGRGGCVNDFIVLVWSSIAWSCSCWPSFMVLVCSFCSLVIGAYFSAKSSSSAFF